jgi:carbamoyl-phosphate synthase small subunit
MTASEPEAMLVLEDGTTLRGKGFGGYGESFGEMVFNTGMTGYQETLTDPSYCGQIVAMTAPHIGNTGINDADPESHRIWVSGYVVREPSRLASSWRAQRSLEAELKAQGITGIAIPGTRALTMRLREHGAMRAAVSTVEDNPARLLERVLASPGMTGADLARIVTTPHPYTVTPPAGVATRYRVAAVDLGIKNATPRNMAARGMEVRVLPATSTAGEILAINPDGVFFSNGPGDPAAAGYAVAAMRGVLDAGVPIFGICFGSQILSRAVGLDTYKLRYGHRGVNQPVMDLATGRVYITSHNHGFAAALPPEASHLERMSDIIGSSPDMRRGVRGVAPPGDMRMSDIIGSSPDMRRGVRGVAPPGDNSDSWVHVPPGARKPFGTPYGEATITHVNLNDGVVEGIRLLDKPAFAVQYHPEAAPGPHDAVDLFDQFARLMDRANKDGGQLARERK